MRAICCTHLTVVDNDHRYNSYEASDYTVFVILLSRFSVRCSQTLTVSEFLINLFKFVLLAIWWLFS
jgi:hypothetical protein